MSRSEIITGVEGFRDLPLGQYQFPSEEGYFIGTLVYRAWHPKQRCLMCFFDTDNGEHFKPYAWWDKDYAPKDHAVSFTDDVVSDSRWKCEYTLAPKGSMTWLSAQQVL